MQRQRDAIVDWAYFKRHKRKDAPVPTANRGTLFAPKAKKMKGNDGIASGNATTAGQRPPRKKVNRKFSRKGRR